MKTTCEWLVMVDGECVAEFTEIIAMTDADQRKLSDWLTHEKFSFAMVNLSRLRKKRTNVSLAQFLAQFLIDQKRRRGPERTKDRAKGQKAEAVLTL